jgi:hypothetical protein
MTSSEEPSSPPCPAPEPAWTHEASLQFIRDAGPVFDALSVCPALAGGVLLRGSSNSDLDIQLIPRKDTAVRVDNKFIETLASRLGLKFEKSRKWAPCVMLLKFSRPSTGHEIDFFVATPHNRLGAIALSAPTTAPIPMPNIETRPYIDPRTKRPTRGHPM